MEKKDLVLGIAKKFVDQKYKEKKNNNTIFGKWYGLNNNPWCAMFVSYCFNAAGAGHLVDIQSPKGFAGCQSALEYFASHRQLIPIGLAEAGDIVFFNFDSDAHTAEHVGIVVSNNGSTLTTYEGNTVADHSGSQSNGDGVYVKHRPYSKVIGVARPRW